MPPLKSTLMQAALVTALTVAIYAPGLSVSPPHLTHDEIKFALQAKAIADTGRDLNGRLLPLYFQEAGFAVGRDPICIYVTAAVLTALPLSERSIRLATVLVGAVGVGLMFIFARLFFERRAIPWIAALIFALTPTYYIHSRLSLSVVYPVPFTVLWLIACTVYFRTRRARDAAITGLLLGAGVYSYLAAAMMMPLYLVLTIALLLVRRDRRGAGVMLLGFVVMLLPLVAWQLIEPDRYANILSAYRLYDGDTTSGGGLLQRLATVSGLVSRIDILWDTFNPGRLFFTGESSLQISTRGVGSFLTPVAVLVALGLIAFFQKRATLTDTSRLVLAGLVTAPLPAVMMADVEIRRWLVIVPFVATIACVGVDHLLGRGNVARAAAAVLVALLPLQFAGFMRDYFGPYREGASSWFGGNIRAALETVIDDAVRQPPSAVYIATEIPWVEAYWRFYSLAHGVDLGGRVHYIQLSAGELPRAQPGAVIVTPAPDASLAARLAEAGWTTQRVIPDLDGRPSMTVATGAAP